jgi:hypothetical protein
MSTGRNSCGALYSVILDMRVLPFYMVIGYKGCPTSFHRVSLDSIISCSV